MEDTIVVDIPHAQWDFDDLEVRIADDDDDDVVNFISVNSFIFCIVISP
jgi:hypothetical protein